MNILLPNTGSMILSFLPWLFGIILIVLIIILVLRLKNRSSNINKDNSYIENDDSNNQE